jgi:flagellum-specific peptidoglycan hydrolase FlgJ
MHPSYDLTNVYGRRPTVAHLPKPHVTAFALKKVLWASNFAWLGVLGLVASGLYLLYALLLHTQGQNLSANSRIHVLEQDIVRLQKINEASTAQVIDLARKIQHAVDTASGDQRQFLMYVIPRALEIQAAYQIPASATISMAIYESNYGRSELAMSHNNFFGIKAMDRSWEGDKVYISTRDSGVRTMAWFRAYENKDNGLEGYAEFLRTNGRYQPAFQFNRGEQFVEAVLTAGYCPDKDYLGNIRVIMERHRLADLDLPEKFLAMSPLEEVLGKSN